MDKQAYIASVRELGEKFGRIESRKGWRASLLAFSPRRVMRAKANVSEQYVRELRELVPPPEDGEALEINFLHPTEEKARKLSTSAAARSHRWQKPEAPEPFDYQGQLDLIDFCVAYGLVDPPDWKLRATYEERVRKIGLTPTNVVRPRSVLSNRQRRELKRARVTGGYAKPLSSAINRKLGLTSGVGVAMRIGLGWVCFFVASDAPDLPMGVLLRKPPPRRWREHPTFLTAMEILDQAACSLSSSQMALFSGQQVRRVLLLGHRSDPAKFSDSSSDRRAMQRSRVERYPKC